MRTEPARSARGPGPVGRRRPHFVVLGVLCAVATACGGAGTTAESGSTPPRAGPVPTASAPTAGSPPTVPGVSLATASMPLQAQGLAVGGDVQTRATDVVTMRITREQAQEIAALCDKAVEVATPQDHCLQGFIFAQSLVAPRQRDSSAVSPCQRDDPDQFCLTVRRFAGSDASMLGVIGYAEVNGLSCSAERTAACLRVGLRTGEVLDQVAPPAPRVAVATASATLTTPPSTTPASSVRSSTPPTSESPQRTAGPVGTASAQPAKTLPAPAPSRSP
jgi:hypothetical protein